MTRVNATYDGEVLRPDGPLPLAPNTRVVVTVESSDTPETTNGPEEPSAYMRAARALARVGLPDAEAADTPKSDASEEAEGACKNGEVEPYAFFRAAREARLEGPPDWSERLDYYLYGVERDD